MKILMKSTGRRVCIALGVLLVSAALSLAVSAAADAGLAGSSGTAGNGNTADSGLIASEQAEPAVPNYAGGNSVVSAPGSNGTSGSAAGHSTGSSTGSRTAEGRTGMGSASAAGRSSTTVTPSGTSQNAGDYARSEDTTLGDTDGDGRMYATGGESAGEAVGNAANAVRDTVRFHPLALLALLALIVVLVIVTRRRTVRT